MTNGGESGNIKHRDNEDFDFDDAKITRFMLYENGKHYKEFVNVGYSSDNPQQLYDDITEQFDKNKLVYRGINSGGNESYNQLMRLGVTRKKNFMTGFEIRDGRLRFVTAFMVPGVD